LKRAQASVQQGSFDVREKRKNGCFGPNLIQVFLAAEKGVWAAGLLILPPPCVPPGVCHRVVMTTGHSADQETTTKGWCLAEIEDFYR